MSKQSGLDLSTPTRRSRPAARRSRPSVVQRLRRRDIILLTGLAALACSSLITVGLLIVRFQTARTAPAAVSQDVPKPVPVHTVPYVEITGLSQYPPAEQQARQWAEDAQLTAAFASWPQVTAVDQIGAPGRWTYRFYSPAKERLLIVRVDPDDQLQVIEHVVQITLPPPLLGTNNWLIDSPTALATWLDYGGADLVRRNPGLEVLIQLRSLNNYPGPVWMVVGNDQRTRDILVVLVDASEGTVIPTNPAP